MGAGARDGGEVSGTQREPRGMGDGAALEQGQGRRD